MSVRAAPRRRSWVEVDGSAILANARTLLDRVPGARLLPMVKADGYGIGVRRVVEALRPLEPWGFGVATLDEGLELKRAGVESRVLVFAACGSREAAAMLDGGLEPCVTSVETLRACAEASRGAGATLPVHLEIDTGMGRAGLLWSKTGDWLPELAAALAGGRLLLASSYTHFHSSESDPAETRAQWERYEAVLSRMREAGLDPGLRHAANSAAVIRHPEYAADLVRPGLFLYGGGRDEPRPRPVIRVRSRVLDVREVDRGATVSYGATWVTERESRLATLGIGYADGLPVAASNRGAAILRGRRVPIRGRVCMDVTVVDASGTDVRPGMIATLLGRDGEEEITLEELADTCGTIEYEVLTGLGPRLARLDVEPSPVQGEGSEGEAGGRGSAGARG